MVTAAVLFTAYLMVGALLLLFLYLVFDHIARRAECCEPCCPEEAEARADVAETAAVLRVVERTRGGGGLLVIGALVVVAWPWLVIRFAIAVVTLIKQGR